jgi:Tol biopolymer transport system component
VGGAAGGVILVQQINESGYISHRLFYQSPGGEPSPLAESLTGAWVASVSPNGDAVLVTGGDLDQYALKGDYSLSSHIAVFLVRLDSGLTTNLSDSENWSLTPDWSPDGQQVVYADTDGPIGNIVRVNADGSQPVQLTLNGVSFRPRWSPRGDQIAYLQRYSSEQAHVYVMDVGGENVRQLTDGPVEDGFMDNLAWSPNGRFLAFLRAAYDPSAPYKPTSVTLQVIDMDSGEVAVIDAGPAKLPAWSADGRLAFVRGEFGSPSSSAVLVLENDLSVEFPLEDGAARTRQLADYPEQQIDQMQWSPDGTLIQYSLKDLDDYHNDTVIVLDAGSGEVVEQMDDYDFLYWLPASPPAAAAMPDCLAGPSQFEAGQQVVLSPERASSPLRALPGTRPLMISEIGQGVQMILLERACAPGRIYWQVQLPDGQVGWTAEGDGQQAWLEP